MRSDWYPRNEQGIRDRRIRAGDVRLGAVVPVDGDAVTASGSPVQPTEFLRTQIGAVVRRAVARYSDARNDAFFDALQADLAKAGHAIVRVDVDREGDANG